MSTTAPSSAKTRTTARRLGRAIMWCAAALLLVIRPSQPSPRASVTREARSSAAEFALIYSRPDTTRNAPYTSEIVWQKVPSRGPGRVIYTSHPQPVPHDLPGGLGFLPSPDGQRVLVWETQDTGHGAPLKTEWVVLSLPSLTRTQLGEAPGAVGVFPYWSDDGRWLTLERGDRAVTFDTRIGRLSGPLPLGPAGSAKCYPRDIDEPWSLDAESLRAKYVRSHYRDEADTLALAFPRLHRELGLTNYLLPRLSPEPDTIGDILLRALGVVDMDSGIKRHYPEVSFSPDRRLLARSIIWFTAVADGAAAQQEGRGEGEVTYRRAEARLDVYEVSTGRHLWGARGPWHTPLAVLDDDPFPIARYDDRYWDEPFFRDVRWSPDGRYLSNTTWRGEDRGAEVAVVDTATWRRVLHIANARNAFVIPIGPRMVHWHEGE